MTAFLTLKQTAFNVFQHRKTSFSFHKNELSFIFSYFWRIFVKTEADALF